MVNYVLYMNIALLPKFIVQLLLSGLAHGVYTTTSCLTWDCCVWLCSDAGRSLHGAVLDSSAGVGVRPGLFTEHKTARASS